MLTRPRGPERGFISNHSSGQRPFLTVSGDLSNNETVTISIEIRAFSVCSSTQKVQF